MLTYDTERARLSLSTRKLEPSPGDMLRNPQLVFEKADEMAAQFRRVVDKFTHQADMSRCRHLCAAQQC